MKKLFFIATVLVMTAFSMTSCSSSDDDGGGESTFTTPAMAADAIKLDDFSTNTIESIEITASGNYLAYLSYNYLLNSTEAAQKSLAVNYVSISGKVTKKDNVYTLENLGTLTITKGTGNTVNYELNALNGTSSTGTADNDTETVTDQTTINLCRTWSVYSTSFRYEEFTPDGEAKTPVGATFKHGNLQEMAEWLYKNHSVDIREELGRLKAIENVIFTPNSFAINFTEDCYQADWEWENKAKGLFEYNWCSIDMYTNFDSGLATVTFSGNYAVLTLQGNLEGLNNDNTYKVSLKIALQEVK